MAGEFDVETMMQHINSNNVEEHKRTTLKVLRFVIANSAVDKGTYKANHQVTNNSETDLVLDEQDKSGTATLAKGVAIINDFKDYGTTTVQNNVPYAQRLEFGWSDQRPNGIYRLASQAAVK